MLRMLIVDDEELTREGITNALDWSTFGVREIRTAADGLIGLQIAQQFLPDIVLTDVRMPGLLGVSMAKYIQAFLPDCQTIFLSGYSDKEYLMDAIKLGAVDYIEKPVDLDLLRAAVAKAAEQFHSAQKMRAYADEQLQRARQELVLRAIQPDMRDAEALARAWQTADCPSHPLRALVFRFARKQSLALQHAEQCLCQLGGDRKSTRLNSSH